MVQIARVRGADDNYDFCPSKPGFGALPGAVTPQVVRETGGRRQGGDAAGGEVACTSRVEYTDCYTLSLVIYQLVYPVSSPQPGPRALLCVHAILGCTIRPDVVYCITDKPAMHSVTPIIPGGIPNVVDPN